MKKIVLLSLVSLMTTMLWATDPSLHLQKPMATTPGSKKINVNRSRNNIPNSSQRSSALQTVTIGKAGNLLSILNANCHQLDADSVINTVLFVHRSDTALGYNVAQYRYDISKNGGSTWNVNIGPLNPSADNITINGRYPEAVISRDSTYNTSADSARIVYNGSWHNGGTSNIWQGQYYGVGQLSGNPATYTEHHEIVNNANVEIATGMIESSPGHYWNINLNYTLNGTADTIRGIILERGVWSDSAKEVLWTYQNININSQSIYNTSGTITGNNLGNPTISFDPSGKNGWLLLKGDISPDANYSNRPIYMHTTDYGATWTAPQELVLDGLPGMFTPPSSINTSAGVITTIGTTTVGSIQIATDSAGNPHIAAIVGIADTSSNQYSFFPSAGMFLFDISYDPNAAGCNWQAHYLSQVFGYSAYYTSDNVGDGNRVQISRSKDAKKIFIFWDDSDSTLVSTITDVNNTNPNPNLFGVGIDMSSRKISNVVNFTAGDPLFGGQVTSPASSNGTIGGALFPVISPNARNLGNGNYNIPVVLTEPDYLNALNKSSLNPARFYYCQNIDFSQAQFVNKFDNVPPTLSINGPDTLYILVGQPYNLPTATATDCVYGSNINITHVTTSNTTDTAGVFYTTWTATNPAGNSSTITQTVIVSGPPIARFTYSVATYNYKFTFNDVSLNFPTNRVWYWGDNTSNNLNQIHATKSYSTSGTKCVVLKVWNQYGTSYDTTCLVAFANGINDEAVSNKISVYPNPSAGIMTMELASDIATGSKVSVYNILGEQVESTVTIKDGTTKSTLNFSNLDSGAYLLKIETSEGIAIKEITINK